MRRGFSDRRVQPLRNHHPNPKLDVNASPFFAANGAVLTRVAETRLGSAFCLRVDFPSGGVADSGVNLTTGITPATLGGVGRKFTLAFDISAADAGASTLRLSRQGGTTAGSPINEAFAVPVGAAARRSFTFSTATTNPLSIYILRSAAGVTGSFFISNLMIVEGAYSGPFRDGSSPGWKWLGAAGASASAGWPRP